MHRRATTPPPGSGERLVEDVTLVGSFARARTASRAPALADAPNRVEFCVGEPVRWTYAQVRERADRLAAALVAEGVRPGDVVVVQLPNVAKLVLTYLATRGSARS
jgi:non-ribosomal peptide synthetase component E (peptide arylation enzyme)